MRFAKEFPDELRLQILASDVVGRRVSLKQKGKEHSGLCPFHNEKTPSFTVNDQKGFYHCFGCGAHGDIIKFVMETQGLGFKEAVISLANDYAISIPFIKEERSNQEEQREKEVDRAYLLAQKASEFFQHNLFSYDGVEALNYLTKKRGLSKDNIKYFGLGFAQDSFESLANFLTGEGFSEKELLESGIIGRNKSGNLYDKFRNRIIFPILNKRGSVIAFGGRALGDAMPKYLNSSETNLFKKGHTVYNYSKARKAIYEQKFVCLVEGYMDVISLSVNNIENVVAPLGTAITADQLKELFRITEDVVICLDGDNAGVNAMRRAIDISLPIINAKHHVRFAFLPAKMDPDDFVKSFGANALRDLLVNAKNLSEILFDYEAKDLGLDDVVGNVAPEKKLKLENRLMQKVNLIIDADSKRHFSQYYKERLFYIGRKMQQKNRKNNPLDKSQNKHIYRSHNSDNYAKNIISMLVLYPSLANYHDEDFNIRHLDFENEELSNLKESVLDFIDHNENYDVHEAIKHLEKFEAQHHFKDKIFIDNKVICDLDNAQLRFRVLVLKYYHEQVSTQYKEALNDMENIHTDEASIKGGRQKEIFNHKTSLERKILQLESDMV
ncbi:MAG: DNA primase [Proteobacteria bacterium]|nr:DNA primase [Pseudomonadota bacterium]